jgi:hypothetical protein
MGLDRNLVICPSGSRIDPIQENRTLRRMESRHCERSEAIHSQGNGHNGLLRRCAPRNDRCLGDGGGLIRTRCYTPSTGNGGTTMWPKWAHEQPTRDGRNHGWRAVTSRSPSFKRSQQISCEDIAADTPAHCRLKRSRLGLLRTRQLLDLFVAVLARASQLGLG